MHVTMAAVLLVLALTTPLAASGDVPIPLAKAENVQVREVYHPAERPGYACWTVLWHDPEGALHLAFAEKRRAPNPLWEPVPLDFWESMGLPINYHVSFCNGSKDVITELVVLRSTDDGETWTETGRCPSKAINAFAWAGLPGGRIIRVASDDYVAFDPAYKPQLRAEVSADGGTTWQVLSVLLEGFSTYPYRLKRLRDGALVLASPYQAAFGPGRERVGRNCARPYVRDEVTCAVFVSRDEAKTWSGPQTVFPGIGAWEPDFVELPSGDLLFVVSTIQGVPQMRQYFRKTPHGFVPGPVLDIVSGRAPECLVYTRSGLLVGAVRGGEYVCSADEGANWYPIHGLPRCNYQPYMAELSDGRLLCSWHIGGDNFFGELDQWVGSHTFRLDAHLPQPTKLTIARMKNEPGTQYINKYVATLANADGPVPGKTVTFAYHKRYTPDYNASPDPQVAGTRQAAVTDANGQVFLDLSMWDNETSIHISYRVTAWFTPEPADTALGPCKSDIYFAYTRNMTQNDLK